ncbi:hypothetical protein NA57DRAFT_60946 [Rhizodiscina lignyota]|uniref:Bacteriophage T5 Orf172 DNA-binding domain-containing protein n=1 Tax=Rhizodiscina lignyota TaxID=1504668 RepID=A0A9P4M164_9PEZI|nr:hypothetical protein NA57DRAFT_60946 [Rhizodiscina lignyota]
MLYRISRQAILDDIAKTENAGDELELQCIALRSDVTRCEHIASLSLTEFIEAFLQSIPAGSNHGLRKGLLCPEHESRLTKKLKLQSARPSAESLAYQASPAPEITIGSPVQPSILVPSDGESQSETIPGGKRQSQHGAASPEGAPTPSNKHGRAHSGPSSATNPRIEVEGVEITASTSRLPSNLSPPASRKKGRRKSAPGATTSSTSATPVKSLHRGDLSEKRTFSESHSVARIMSNQKRMAGSSRKRSSLRESDFPERPATPPNIDSTTRDDRNGVSDTIMQDYAEDVDTAEDSESVSIVSTPSKPSSSQPPNTKPPKKHTPTGIDQLIKERLRQPKPSRVTETTGYVYMIQDSGRPHLIKIGCSKGQPITREDAIETTCNIVGDLSIIRDEQLPHRYYLRVEKLVHAELKHFQRPYLCDKCRRTHRETDNPEMDELCAPGTLAVR